MNPKIHEYTYDVQCKGCDDTVPDNIADLYVYGYCVDCTMKIPDYIEQVQWERWLNGHFKEQVS